MLFKCYVGVLVLILSCCSSVRFGVTVSSSASPHPLRLGASFVVAGLRRPLLVKMDSPYLTGLHVYKPESIIINTSCLL